MLLGYRSTDAELVQEVLQGNRQRFAELVDRYRNLVYSTILARVSDPDEADDLAQEAFLKAFHQLDRLHDPRKFGPWLRRIAENLAYSWLRRREVRAETTPAVLYRPVDSPDQVYERQEESERIWGAIDRLPEEQRQVVLLFYMEDCERAQIARFLDLPEENVKTRLRRAREVLKGELEEEFDRKVRRAVQQQKRGKEFTRKVMGALPLATWLWHRPPVFWRWLGWGAQAGMAGLLGVVLIGFLQGWLTVRQPLFGVQEEILTGVRVHLASEEEYLRILDRTRFPQVLEQASSIFGTEPLGREGRQLQEEAFRRGWGGAAGVGL